MSQRPHALRLSFVIAPLILFAGCGQRSQTGSTDANATRDIALTNTPSSADPTLADTARTHARTERSRSSREAGSGAHHTRAAAPAASTPAIPASAPAPQAPVPAPLPPLVAGAGTPIDLVVADTITTATAHVGDPVAASVANDVRDASGVVVIPAGSPVRGSVAASSGSGHSPHLDVRFTTVSVGGRDYALDIGSVTLPIVEVRRTARVAQVGEVAGGAAAGGLLGRLIGGKKSGGTIIGAVAGAAAGAVVANKTESHDAVLPKGAHVKGQLASSVTVPQA